MLKHISKLCLIFLITIMTLSVIAPATVQADTKMITISAELSGQTKGVDSFATSPISIIAEDTQGVIDQLLELLGEFFRVISEFFGLISEMFSSSS